MTDKKKKNASIFKKIQYNYHRCQDLECRASQRTNIHTTSRSNEFRIHYTKQAEILYCKYEKYENTHKKALLSTIASKRIQY